MIEQDRIRNDRTCYNRTGYIRTCQDKPVRKGKNRLWIGQDDRSGEMEPPPPPPAPSALPLPIL